MSVPALAEVVGLMAYLLAGAILLRRGRIHLSRDMRWSLYVLVLVGASLALLSAVERIGDVAALDPIEDLLRAIQPLTWGALLYVYSQDSARERLMRRESLLGAALDGGRLGAWDWDLASGRVNWSGLARDILGSGADLAQATIEDWNKCLHPDDIGAVNAQVAQSIEFDTPYRVRYRIVRDDGQARRIEATGKVIRDGHGVAVRMVGTVRDLADEDREREERTRLAEIVDATSDFICTMDADGNIRYLNGAARRLLGFDAHEHVGSLMIAELLGEEHSRKILNEAVPAALDSGLWEGHGQVCAHDGQTIPASQVIVAHRVIVGDSDAKLFSMVLRDVSERERADAKLRASEARYRDFASSAADWVWEMGPDLRFRYLSARVEAFTGLPPSAFIGRTRAQLGLTDERDAEAFAAHMKDLEAHRAFRDFRYRSKGASGEWRWSETSGQPIFDDNGEFAGYRGTSRDITDQALAVEALQESEERFRNLIEGSNQGIFIQRDFRPLFVNIAFAKMLGYDTPEEVMALDSISEFFAPGEVERLRRYSELRLSGVDDAPQVYEYEAIRRDGRRVVLEHAVRRVHWHGAPAVQVVAVDVTKRRQAEAALRESEARYRALYDDNPSTYVTVNSEGVVQSINLHGAEQIGYEASLLIGASARKLYPQEQRSAFDRFLQACLQEPGVLQHWELPKVRADGSIMWARESARAVRDNDGEAIVLIVSEDVSDAHSLSERLAHEASHDGLTGLINRREFEIRLQRVIETAHESQTEHALCYLDLDQFKIVNDTCGHMAGDELLRQLGSLFKNNVRRRDTLARLGGDEFALLIEHCPIEQAIRIANQLHAAVREFKFHWDTQIFSIGVSIGVVPIDIASPSAAHVLGLADQACYVAKEQGRNRIHVYREDDKAILRRTGEMQWVARLSEAIENNRFRLARQPIKSLGALSPGNHFELLLRMCDEHGELIAPGAFLPAAERYDIAVRIDRWVVDAALDWLSASPREVDALYLCAINLSGQSLGDESFLQHILARIGDSNVPPSKLCFEITETAVIVNLSSAHTFINALRAIGCQFALDDFGSGLSSFGYLKSLPVDFLKIDGGFVKDILDDPIDQAMVEAINRIGQVMGKTTIAEFVESEAVLQRLVDIGVDYAQGYHVGKPQLIDLGSSS